MFFVVRVQGWQTNAQAFEGVAEPRGVRLPVELNPFFEDRE